MYSINFIIQQTVTSQASSSVHTSASNYDKKLSWCRETARCFMSLKISLVGYFPSVPKITQINSSDYLKYENNQKVALFLSHLVCIYHTSYTDNNIYTYNSQYNIGLHTNNSKMSITW